VYTLNPRLFPDQMAYIASTMRTTVTCFSIPRSHRSSKYTRRSARTVRCWIALADEAPLPAISIPALSYETLLAPHEGAFDWRLLDERTATFLLQVGHDGKSASQST
jgi:3-(methylthio)propionyl---CoA ligase